MTGSPMTSRTASRGQTRDQNRDRGDEPVLEVRDLGVQFAGRPPVRAVDGLSLSAAAGEIVGLVGESGCGKSAAVRAIAGLHDDARVEGSVRFDGIDLLEASDERLRRVRARRLSTVFQDPSATLTPTRSVRDHLVETLRLADRPGDRSLRAAFGLDPRDRGETRRERTDRAVEVLEAVDLSEGFLERYPHELSGGEAQRVSLAIALASDPDLLLADEPTTALDATTQAAILDLLVELAAERELAVVLVSHDLGLIADACDRVVVAYAGCAVETGRATRVLESPAHPYTRALLACRLDGVDPGTRLPTIEGTVPDPTADLAGCPFAPRCPHATAECRTIDPPVVDIDGGRVRCGELERVLEDSAERTDDGRRVSAADGGCSSAVNANGDSSTTGTNRGSSTGERCTTERTLEGESARNGRNDDSKPNQGVSNDTDPLLELRDVTKRFPVRDSWLARRLGRDRWTTAVDDVSLTVRRGETLGLVGESGAGKSTVIDLVTGLEEPTSGSIRIDGESVGAVGDRSREQVATIGRVFQHPRSSLDPRQSIETAIAEPLVEAGWSREDRRTRVAELLELVGLERRHADRRPGQLSGGQCQRVALARAIALEPALVVLDEPTSALDVSVRARVCNLLLALRERLGSAFVLVSHDLAIVAYLADRIAVLRNGRVLERGETERIREKPDHEYTERLLRASGLESESTTTETETDTR